MVGSHAGLMNEGGCQRRNGCPLRLTNNLRPIRAMLFGGREDRQLDTVCKVDRASNKAHTSIHPYIHMYGLPLHQIHSTPI
jgi:hypothetical protein